MYYNKKNHHNNNGDFLMDFDRKILKKGKNITPIDIKDNNKNLCNTYDFNLKSNKNSIDGFEIVTKVKRNFK